MHIFLCSPAISYRTRATLDTIASRSQLALAPLLLDLPNLSHTFSEPHDVPLHEAPPHLEHGRGQRGDQCQVRRDEVVGERDRLRRRQRRRRRWVKWGFGTQLERIGGVGLREVGRRRSCHGGRCGRWGEQIEWRVGPGVCSLGSAGSLAIQRDEVHTCTMVRTS